MKTPEQRACEDYHWAKYVDAAGSPSGSNSGKAVIALLQQLNAHRVMDLTAAVQAEMKTAMDGLE